jgi:localization factor PodJL
LFGIAVLATALVTGKREKDAVEVGVNFSDMRTLSLPEPTVRDPNDTLFVVEIPRIDGLPTDLQNSYSSPGEHGAISEKALRDMAKNGNPKANTILGLRALDDRGAAPVSLPEAVRYLKRAAEGGNPIAQFRLASLYEHGDGVATDLANAKRWYELAANQGNRKAMHNLAVFYSSGAAGGKDLQQAAYWFAEAASLGVTDSQFNLAFLYEHGYGVTKNLVEAGKWYSIAARSGDEESRKHADLLQLGTVERAAVSRAAKDFRAVPFDAAANVPPEASSL